MAGILLGAALVGLVTGSFLTVLIRRLGTGETFLGGRSHCPNCATTLRWFELLPVVSFLLQGGQCRSCRRSISGFYPAVELITAGLFMLTAWGMIDGFLAPPPFLVSPASGSILLTTATVWFLYDALFIAIAVTVSVYDFERRMIPRGPIRMLAGVGALAQLAGFLTTRDLAALGALAAVAGGSFLLFWSLWFFSRGRAMGRGDADVGLAIALAIGPGTALLGLALAFWIGAAFGILMVLIGRMRWSSAVPFAPFLFGGAVGALFLIGQLTVLHPFSYGS